jgi:hypothetical protein
MQVFAGNVLARGSGAMPNAIGATHVYQTYEAYKNGEGSGWELAKSVLYAGAPFTVGRGGKQPHHEEPQRVHEPIVSQSHAPGLSNRGYRPQPGERTTTQAEYRIQSSAERNFPGQQHEMNCAPQSCQQIIRASNGKNSTEAEMISSATTSANYNSKTGTAATKVPSILNAEGVKASNMPNKPEHI